MLSRVAERLYWFARYVERIENTARLLLVQHHLMLDLPVRVQPGWNLLIQVLGADDAFKQVPGKATEKTLVRFVFGNRENPSSILSSILHARENIRTTREVMPKEVWERTNSLYLSVSRRRKQDLPRNQRHKILNDIIQRCQQITGMLSGCMNHEQGYVFMVIGRNLERADMTTRIIDVGSAQFAGVDEEIAAYNGALWVGVLKSLSAYQMYLQVVQRSVNEKGVLAFLLHNKAFPRAIAHTLSEITSGVESLPRNAATLGVLHEVAKHVNDVDLAQLQGMQLHAFIDDLQLQLERIHASIYDTWFDPKK